MTVYRYIFWLTLLCIPLATLGISTANAQQSQIPVSDLGTREQGRVYPLKLTAVNVDCDSAQNFEFEIDSTPWLLTPGGTSVHGLGPGQSKSIQAQLDFTYIPPGIYYSHLTARCTSCGWYIFSACIEHGQDIVLKVKVADPADPTNGTNIPEPANPYADLQPYVPSNIALDPPIGTADENLLTAGQRNRLFVVRNAVKAAQTRGEKARDDVRAARLKKSDCERELARLKAAMEAAKRKAAIAAQDAANAQGAADAAAKELADYEKDMANAQKAIDRADAQARVAIKYYKIVLGQDGGSGGQRAQNARAQSDKFQKEWDEAKAAYRKIANSYAARKQAADQAKRQAEAAKANARQAQADANAATNRYNAKARECKGATAALTDAQKKLDDAKKAAAHAVGVANYEESEAKKKADKARKEAIAQGVRDLEKELKKKEKECKRIEKEWKEKMRQMTNALNALKQNGHFKSSENAAKNPPTPTSLFDQYVELGFNTALDTVGTISGAPGAGGGKMLLDVLLAGYGIAAIRQSQLIPGTKAHGDSDGQELRDWLIDNNFANADPKDKDVNEVEEEMREIVNDSNYMAEQIQRGVEAVRACKRELAALKAKLAAAKTAKK